MKTKLFALILLATVLIPVESRASDIVRDTMRFVSQTATSPSEFIAGRISGVRVSSVDGNDVSGLQNINIRGVGNIRSDCQPLYIIDGIILGSGINSNLDPFWQLGEAGYAAPVNPLAFIPFYRIESIEVLKNASETAKYGSLGANGVVIITTKRNKTTPWSLDADTNVGVRVGSGMGGV